MGSKNLMIAFVLRALNLIRTGKLSGLGKREKSYTGYVCCAFADSGTYI